MHRAQDVPIQPGATETRHVTAKEGKAQPRPAFFLGTAKLRPSLLDLGALGSEDFSDILDDAVAIGGKEFQPKLAERPSSPSADASYELSKPGRDLDSEGLHNRMKRARFDEPSTSSCLQCYEQGIRVSDTA